MSGRAITNKYRLLSTGPPEKTCWQTDQTLGELSAEATTGFPLDPPAVIDFTGLPQLGETTWFTRPALVRAFEPVPYRGENQPWSVFASKARSSQRAALN